MRGKVPMLTVNPLVAGITPAYAGKSTKGTGWNTGMGDHPRLCGEK